MDHFTDIDRQFMTQALDLASKALGNTRPNPLVGAIIVKNGQIIGKGYHKFAGTDHAEIMALKSCSETPQDSTIYVTLEPCSHYGRTPPCAEALIKAGIKKVRIAVTDPNPKVSGKGIRMLKKAGIDVLTGLCQKEAVFLNDGFIFFHQKKRPLIVLKSGQSLDGKIATVTGESKWITGSLARIDVQRLRMSCDAILVGSETVVKDNPSLTVRAKKLKINPLRIVLDGRGRLDPSYQIFDTNEGQYPTLWVTGQRTSKTRISDMKSRGVEVLIIPGVKGILDLSALINELTQRYIRSILVEGGSKIQGSFLEAGLVDKVVVYIAPKLIGGESAPVTCGGNGISKLDSAMSLYNTQLIQLGSDYRFTGYSKSCLQELLKK